MPRRCRRFKMKSKTEQKEAIDKCRRGGGTWSHSYCMCKKKKQVGIGASVVNSPSESLSYRGAVYVLVESKTKLKSPEKYKVGQRVVSVSSILPSFREGVEIEAGTRGRVVSIKPNGGIVVLFKKAEEAIVVLPKEIRRYKKRY